jgi:hypothetical protein
MEHELYMLEAVSRLGALTYGQITRFLFEGGIVPECDLLPCLAALKERGLVNQVLSPAGIVLEITEAGREWLSANEAAIPERARSLIAQKSGEYARVFELEQNYLAQYSEQSSGVVPVTLSVRENGKIVLRVNVIVNRIETAKKICAGWMKNSPRAYGAFWAAVAEGEPEPGFWRNRPGEV